MGFKIEIPGEPIAKARPFFVHKDRKGRALPYVKVINKQEKEEAAFKWAVINALSDNGGGLVVLEDIPLALGLTYIMPVRKSWPQYKIRDLQRGMTFYHFGTPDLDNLIKFTKDCLQGLIFKNDSQVAILYPAPIKKYGLEPKTIITIRVLPEFEMPETSGVT